MRDLKHPPYKFLLILASIILAVIFVLYLRGKLIFPSELNLFFFRVKWYGIFITGGIFLVAFLTAKAAQRYSEFQNIKVEDLLIAAIVPGIIGARLWHVATTWSYYQDHLAEIIKIWEGGLGIFGGLLFGALGLYLAASRQKLNFKLIVNLLAIFLPLGQVIGRFGNFANQELYGAETNLPWGQYIVREDSFHHPAFLYEQIGNLILFSLLYFIYKKVGLQSDWRYVAGYFLGYGIVRFMVDFFRPDSKVAWGLTVAQFVCIALTTLSLLYLIYLYGIHKRARN